MLTKFIVMVMVVGMVAGEETVMMRIMVVMVVVK